MNMDDFKLQCAAIFSPGIFPNPGTLYRQYHVAKAKCQPFGAGKLATKFCMECPFYIIAYHHFSGKLPLGETLSALRFLLFPVVCRLLLLSNQFIVVWAFEKKKKRLLIYHFLLHAQRAAYSKMFSKGKKSVLDIWPFWCSAVTEWALPFRVVWLIWSFKMGNSQKLSLQSAAGVGHDLNLLIKDHQFPSSLQQLAQFGPVFVLDALTIWLCFSSQHVMNCSFQTG